MKVVGLTGGIGSGKTTVARMFEELGVPVYVSDVKAKELMHSSPVIKDQLVKAFGTKTYGEDGQLDRAYLASIVFTDQEALKTINSIVHPEVGKDFTRWKAAQEHAYVIKETAILFEHGLEKDCDYVITVTAPQKVRVARVMERDGASEQQVLDRAENQWTDIQKALRSNFVINNIHLKETFAQVEQIHEQIITSCK